MAKSGDPRFVSASGGNRAIEFSKMEASDDGNIYLMRWTSPAIIYAVSPGGEVVHRFTVDPGSVACRPVSMHITGGKIAVLFVNNESTLDTMKVVDLQGRALATYNETADPRKPGQRLGDAFACYMENPERFTFLSFGENNQLEIDIAEPR